MWSWLKQRKQGYGITEIRMPLVEQLMALAHSSKLKLSNHSYQITAIQFMAFDFGSL